ncbi:hypothetical protein GWI33_007053 [Rhynchophorus ferrugineus]|uniref:Uncharacterized protein n=1 Tax=Rhynchophorus ferrugineus TaxID=354439 RepID=A0A834IF11_RHYFE|nr:hypothetical protein GWI33_007053 [Rhynchophorus ferrugineus]
MDREYRTVSVINQSNINFSRSALIASRTIERFIDIRFRFFSSFAFSHSVDSHTNPQSGQVEAGREKPRQPKGLFSPFLTIFFSQGLRQKTADYFRVPIECGMDVVQSAVDSDPGRK